MFFAMSSKIFTDEGLIVGLHDIKIDNDVLQGLQQFNMKVEDAWRMLMNNKHNQITTTYYLCLKKKQS